MENIYLGKTGPKNVSGQGALRQIHHGDLLEHLNGMLFEQLPAAVYCCDREGVLVRWNRRAVELWGRSPRSGDFAERFCGSYKLYRWDGTFMAHADCPVADALRSGQPQRNIEAIIEREDGSRRFILANIEAIKNESGAVVGAINIMQDITERRRTEESLRQSEQRFRRLLDNLPAAGYLCDADGLITYFNERAVQFWGREPKLHDRRDKFCGSFRLFSIDGAPIRHDQSWMALALRNSREYHDCEIVVERPDGARRIASAHVSPFYDEHGRVAGAVNILVDITDRKRKEEALRQSEESLRAIIGQTTAGISQVDLMGQFVLVNQRYCEIVGRSESELLQMQMQDITHPDDLIQNLPLFERLAREGTPFHIEKRYIRPDGSVVWVNNSVSALRDAHGTPNCIICVTIDVTQQKQVEAALRESELRYRLVGEAANDAVWDWDLLTNNATWHQGVQKLFQYSPTEIGPDAQWWYENIHPEDRDRVVHGIHAAIDGGKEFWQDEYRFRRANGSYAEVVDRGRVVHEAGRPVRMVGSMLDLTERKKAENALKESEQRFRSLSACSPVGIFMTDTSGRCTYTNSRYQAICGFTFEQALGEGWSQFVYDEDRASVFRDWAATAKAGRPYSGEFRFQHPNGKLRWVHVRTSPMLSDDGKLLGNVGTVEDITEQKRNEAILAGQKRVLEKLVEGATLPDVLDGLCQIVEDQSEGKLFATVLLVDEDGQRLRSTAGRRISEAYSRAVDGVSIGPSAGSCGTAAYRGEPVVVADIATDPLWADYKQLALQHGLRACWSTPILSSQRKVLGTFAVYYDTPGEPTQQDRSLVEIIIRTAGIAIERRQAEEALQDADRRKDEFLATLAHELRNPLAPIRNALQVIGLAEDNQHLVQQARSIMERQISQMVRLVDDLLDVSRITRDRLELRKEWVELSAAVQSAVEAARPLVEAGKHRLTVNLPGEPVLLHADLTRLAQVFSNLLTNAAKYTESGGDILLKAERTEDELVVRVRDTGIGIPADKLPRIFDLFVQVDRSLERSQDGLGIGLTLVKRLVELHGGSIVGHSDGPGRGSEFTVRLPLSASRCSNAENSSEQAASSMLRGRILVVDDNKDSAESMALMLRIRGAQVRTAHDGVQAIEAAGEFRPDIIFLDIGMPRLNGYDVARHIREQPWAGNVLIVAMTGWGQDEDKRRAEEAGFNYHLTKPLDPAAIEKLFRLASQ